MLNSAMVKVALFYHDGFLTRMDANNPRLMLQAVHKLTAGSVGLGYPMLKRAPVKRGSDIYNTRD